MSKLRAGNAGDSLDTYQSVYINNNVLQQVLQSTEAIRRAVQSGLHALRGIMWKKRLISIICLMIMIILLYSKK